MEEKSLGLLHNPLLKYGVKFAATYIGEAFGNASGGLKQGVIYEGRLNLAIGVDLQKLVGIDKLTFHADMFQIHGDGVSRSTLQNFFVVSGIEALPRSNGARRGSRSRWVSSPPTANSSTPNIQTCSPTPQWVGPDYVARSSQRRTFATLYRHRVPPHHLRSDRGRAGQELPALVKDGYTPFKVFMTYDDLVLSEKQVCSQGPPARPLIAT